MSQGKRYKFNGSTFAVQTGLGADKSVTNITNADPGVVTSAGHGQAAGDVAKFALLDGITPLNGNLYVVDNPDTNSFELSGTDTTDSGTFEAGSPPDGKFNPVTFSPFCELTGLNQDDAGAATIEVTTICSTAKEFEQGLSDSGTLKLDFNWAGNESVQSALRAAKRSGDELAFRISFPKDGGIAIMPGTVLQTSFQGAVNGVWTGSASIKLTGEVFVLPAA